MKDLAYNQKRAAELLNREWKMLVGGEMVTSAEGKTMDTFDPSTARKIAEVPHATREDIHRAVEAADAAFEKWRKVSVYQRAQYIRRMIEVIRANLEDLALLDALNSGNPLHSMVLDANIACTLLEYCVSSALEVKGTTYPATAENLHIVIREPYGVVGRIIPFNHPLMFTAAKIGAPVVMGNTIVMKVPDQAPLACLYLAELIKDVFPPGVVNIVSGDGPITGDAIVKHPKVTRLSLIGSAQTGLLIQRAAAESLVKTVTLELGGKNPMIVFPDANLEKAVAAAVSGMNFTTTQGQSCGSVSRLFLHEDIREPFIEKLVERMRQIKVGIPIDPETQMGSLVSKAQYDKVMGYIAAGQAEGAKLLTGGKKPEDPALQDGYFVEPTLFDGVTMEMRIGKEEIFGPVLSILTWNDEAEVLRLANSTEYGLTGSVWTQDVSKAIRFAQEIDSGYIWVNGAGTHFPGMPYTGRKNSGIGSEESIEELLSFTQLKTINFIV